jgi:hypothetical protein
MNLSILNYNHTIPGLRHDGQSPSSKVQICSPVFKKLYNLGKPRFKKLQHMTKTNHTVVDESVLSMNVSAVELPLDEGAPFCNDEQLGSDQSIPPIKCAIHDVADDDDPFLLVPSDEGAPAASDQHDDDLLPTSTKEVTNVDDAGQLDSLFCDDEPPTSSKKAVIIIDSDAPLLIDPSIPPLVFVIHEVGDDDDPFLLVPSGEGAPTSDQHDALPTSTKEVISKC